MANSSLPHVVIWLGDVAVDQVHGLKVLHEGGMVDTETVLRRQKWWAQTSQLLAVGVA